jgi:hypothetical protein
MWALRLRSFALLGAGALGVHELRYVIAYGGDAGRALADQGHGYLDAVAAVVGLVVLVAVAALLAALVHGAGPARRAGRGWRVRWLAASGALLAIFAVQELLEGALSPRHPGGIAAVLANGGWIAVPLALAFGAAVAALLRGADTVLARFAAVPRVPLRRAPRITLPRAPLVVRARPASALAGPGAGRAPPLLGC